MNVRLGALLGTGLLALLLTSTLHAAQAANQNDAVEPIGKPSSIPGVLAVQPAEVIQLANLDEDMVIFDARSEAQRSKGKLAWSEGFELKQLAATQLASKVASKSTVVLFYGDENDPNAALGAKTAVAKGYTSVYWLQGGWPAWQQSGLRLDQ
ncbi:MAG: hypothetical protein GC149_01555 [Gammaproteobacteria bacterium]|nr:hypothetical protein [Gammaproteobacteria bacterium]